MKRITIPLLLSLAGVLDVAGATDTSTPYPERPEGKAFIERVTENQGWSAEEVTAWLREAAYQDSIIQAISRPAESKPWHEYRPIFLREKRISQGVEFWQEHKELLDQVSARFGVEPQIIVAIVGVETYYGRYKGGYRVLDALATLAFDYPPRGAFFGKELEQFMLLSKEEGIPLTQPVGSYAGAMGMPQFIPSSYRHYAVDFDDDGSRDLFNSLPDILGSVANYFKHHRWEHGEPVAVPVAIDGDTWQDFSRKDRKPAASVETLRGFGIKPQAPVAEDAMGQVLELEGADGPEYWLTFNNFYVITRYNRSPLYAMAVYQLSEAIKARMSL